MRFLLRTVVDGSMGSALVAGGWPIGVSFGIFIRSVVNRRCRPTLTASFDGCEWLPMKLPLYRDGVV